MLSITRHKQHNPLIHVDMSTTREPPLTPGTEDRILKSSQHRAQVFQKQVHSVSKRGAGTPSRGLKQDEDEMIEKLHKERSRKIEAEYAYQHLKATSTPAPSLPAMSRTSSGGALHEPVDDDDFDFGEDDDNFRGPVKQLTFAEALQPTNNKPPTATTGAGSSSGSSSSHAGAGGNSSNAVSAAGNSQLTDDIVQNALGCIKQLVDASASVTNFQHSAAIVQQIDAVSQNASSLEQWKRLSMRVGMVAANTETRLRSQQMAQAEKETKQQEALTQVVRLQEELEQFKMSKDVCQDMAHAIRQSTQHVDTLEDLLKELRKAWLQVFTYEDQFSEKVTHVVEALQNQRAVDRRNRWFWRVFIVVWVVLTMYLLSILMRPPQRRVIPAF
jgi:hypothetical protein